MENARDEGASPRRAMRTYGGWSWRPPGRTDTDRPWEATLRKRQEMVSEEVKEIAWKAQHRLHDALSEVAGQGQEQGSVVTAVGRELLGFIWAIGIKVETAQKESLQRAA